jgi:CRP-like cAMP-binding protein
MAVDDHCQPLLRRNCSYLFENSEDALRVLATRPTGVRGGGEGTTTIEHIERVEIANIRGIIFPWHLAYQIWWYVTVVGAIITVFFSPFQVAFENEPGTLNDTAGWIEMSLNLIFMIDILVNFNLAFYKNEVMVFDRKTIAMEYLDRMFWVDLIGVFPFETVALFMAGILGDSSRDALLFSLLRLVRFVRLHRMKKLSGEIRYDARVSLLASTLLRNFAVVLSCTHCEACCMYFIARLYNFDKDTWLGPRVHDMTGLERYVTSLYWSIVTFCTVGFGDFSCVNTSEQIAGSVFMLLNVVVAAWIIGSITLLIVKGDERTGEYRDSLETLHQYGVMHNFDPPFLNKLKRQLRLEFNNREIADEQVLKSFPSAVRRKILRRLYLEPLVSTTLMEGVRQQFVDAFLSSCIVEIFSPGEEIVERGSILSDLFLLVGGVAEITTGSYNSNNSVDVDVGLLLSDKENGDADLDSSGGLKTTLEAGDFFGEIGFFTESPQVESVSSLTVCKTLTMSRSAYKLLAQDHPGSVGKILHNLLAKVELASLKIQLPKGISVLRAGSVYDPESGYGAVSDDTTRQINEIDEAARNRRQELTAIKDLVKMHMSKQLDDQTTRLLFAASRGDTSTISLMCDNGFNPNNADYDRRTALMVASMKGNTDVAKMLLEYKVGNDIVLLAVCFYHRGPFILIHLPPPPTYN